jgi:CubicO group peptidase (beta-lactamase class C family)
MLAFIMPAHAQRSNAFPRAIPETQGVSSSAIDSFATAASHFHEFHSFMLLRHGKIVAQGWWKPYAANLKHSLYSCSKSFTSTAVGFAVSEHKLRLDDKVISFFPKSLPDTVSPYLSQLTVRDLLTMSVGQEPDPTATIPYSDNWIKAFLATPIVHQPGTRFLYNTMATYMLSAIVQKVTGQKVFDYLQSRLFKPLGITGIDWETSNEGINTGGWGLRLKTEDLAKMGEFYLHKGMWNGKQLLPKEWIGQATTFKIDPAPPGVSQSKRDSSDWMQGYCYQFWRCRHNVYRADGAYGQFIIVMPAQDAVLAITSEGDMQAELNLVWKYLLPAMHTKALPANPVAYEHLEHRLAALQLPPLVNTAAKAENLNEKRFEMQPNALHIKSIKFSTVKDILVVVLNGDTTQYAFGFETGHWLFGVTDMQVPGSLSSAKEDFGYLRHNNNVAGSYGWKDAQTLVLRLRFIESPHSMIITCHFDGDNLNADVQYTCNYDGRKTILKGTLSKMNR